MNRRGVQYFLLGVAVLLTAALVVSVFVRQKSLSGNASEASAPASDRATASETASSAPTSSAPASSATTAASAEAAIETVLWIGDGISAGVESTDPPATSSPGVAAAALGWELELVAQPGMGFAASSTETDETGVEALPELVETYGADSATPVDLVVVDLGRNDDSWGDAQDAAEEFYAAVADGFGDARLVVVMPYQFDGEAPLSPNYNDWVAAELDGALVIDPVGEGWISADSEQYADANLYPNDEGYAYAGEKFEERFTALGLT